MAARHCLLAAALLAAFVCASAAVCDGADVSYTVDDGVIAGPESQDVEEAHGWAEALAEAVAERVGERKGCKAIEKEVQRACRTVSALGRGVGAAAGRPPPMPAGGRATAVPCAGLPCPFPPARASPAPPWPPPPPLQDDVFTIEVTERFSCPVSARVGLGPARILRGAESCAIGASRTALAAAAPVAACIAQPRQHGLAHCAARCAEGACRPTAARQPPPA